MEACRVDGRQWESGWSIMGEENKKKEREGEDDVNVVCSRKKKI
jgi:hypothetical protein